MIDTITSGILQRAKQHLVEVYNFNFSLVIVVCLNACGDATFLVLTSLRVKDKKF